MILKPAVRKILNKYKIAYSDIERQINNLSMSDNVTYRCLKALSKEYNLKISVLESVLDDLECSNIDVDIDVEELNKIVKDLDIFKTDKDMQKKDINISKKDITIKEKDVIISNNDTKIIKSDTSIPKPNSNKVTKDVNINSYDIASIKKDLNFEVESTEVAKKEVSDATKDVVGVSNFIKGDVIQEDEKICGFIGYDYKDIYGYDESDDRYKYLYKDIKQKVEDLILKKGVTVFVTSGRLGFDKLAYHVVDELKIKYPGIANVLAIPFKGQSSKWPSDNQKDYEEMKDRADKLIYVDTVKGYTVPNSVEGLFHKDKIKNCGNFIVDNCDTMFFLYRGETTGGVHRGVQMASKKGIKDSIIINPDKFNITLKK